MSKKKAYIISIITVTIVGLVLYVQIIKPKLENRMIDTVVPATITSQTFPLEFTYPSGTSAYTLIEPPVPTTTSSGLQKVYLIIDNQSYLDFQADKKMKTPPTVSILIFQKPESTEKDKEMKRSELLKVWAEQHPQYTSFDQKTVEPEIVELDGVGALHYLADGVYQQEIYVAAYDHNTYVFTGQFEDEASDIHNMFAEMMQSVIFD